MTLEQCQILMFPKKELSELLPVWYLETHKNLTKKIRLLDSVAHSASLRKFGPEEQKPLSIDEQRMLLALITHQNS